ncbi:RagB/SusD family nutrient uptake outer membrane protein [Bacteroides thetaiotaomicron]|uniref:RagB/SusD family nutrient uptake outer membrane protein n=1 Tax=Bacteroides thetaiotaomicron TaxID=818 RepID=UPI0021669ED4|nr:RagB/SusD family nutrient uptake outer membrane protein [Bacteroides thetaiotaomicron]MCS3079958.1 RagB/SusD family nutrient uptake outer membrane protein [Bacteroides thetaiotaomicron]
MKNDAEINFVDVQSDQFWIEMRMAEVYLIRSEAYARLEKWSEAYIDLNAIRGRVGMPALPQQNVWDSYLTDLEKRTHL